MLARWDGCRVHGQRALQRLAAWCPRPPARAPAQVDHGVAREREAAEQRGPGSAGRTWGAHGTNMPRRRSLAARVPETLPLRRTRAARSLCERLTGLL